MGKDKKDTQKKEKRKLSVSRRDFLVTGGAVIASGALSSYGFAKGTEKAIKTEANTANEDNFMPTTERRNKMNTQSLDLSVFKEFNFEKPPIGVKFLLDKPEGIERLDKKVPYCGMVCEAQNRNTPFYVDIDNHACPLGTFSLGYDLPKVIEGGYLGPELKAFKEAYANRRIIDILPRFGKDTVKYIAFSPMDKLSFTPELFIIMTDNTSQTEILLRAFSYTTGKIITSKMTIVQGCSWIYAYPYLTGEVNYITTGLGFGMKAQKVFPEGRHIITIPYDWLPVITLNLQEMTWVPPSYTEEGPEHDRKLFQKFGITM